MSRWIFSCCWMPGVTKALWTQNHDIWYSLPATIHHHHHHISVMELGHLLTRSGLTYPEVSSKVCHDSFCQLGNSVSLPWGNLLRGILFTCCIQFLLYSSNLSKICVIVNYFAVCVFVLQSVRVYQFGSTYNHRWRNVGQWLWRRNYVNVNSV